MDEIKIIKIIISTLPNKIKLKSNISEDDFNTIKDYVINTVKIFYRDIAIINIETSLVDIFSVQRIYNYNPNITPLIPKFNRIEDKDDYYDKLIDNILDNNMLDYNSILDCDINKIKWYLKLRHLPQPVQKSREWYEMRNNMITASIGASIINESPYQKADDVLRDKIGLGEPYRENKYVHHGKKYEKIATMIYENLYNTKVGEFGLIPYQSKHQNKPTFSFLGASPDGISSPITLDGKLNNKIGTMLEIKCPLSRKIKTSGKIDGTICPHYYWVQIQLQLACCDLNDCDFWQCDISDCSYTDWINYIECNITEEQNTLLTAYNKNIIKGCILQFLPKHKLDNIDDKIEWYAKYVYPVDVTMTTEEYTQWRDTIIKNYIELYPEIAKDYYFDKIIYWKLNKAHNILVTRDNEWFNSRIELFEEFWKKVLYYRNNPNELDKLSNLNINKKYNIENVKSKKQSYLDSLDDDLFLSSEEK